ncbi:hypothetical protein [Anaerosinus sp.]
MSERNFHYNICNQSDEELFKKQCAAIEKHIPHLRKSKILIDVDGSLFQEYRHSKGIIEVSNSHYINALYVDADFDLLPYFKK